MTDAVAFSGFVGASPVSVGRFTYGFEHVSVRQWGEGASLNIGAFCSISSSITIFLGGNHRTDWITTYPFGHIFQDELCGQGIEGHPATNGDVHIGSDVWIGHGVTIMSGVLIASGAVIAANSTVVKNVQPYEIVGGNPAKSIKKRFSDDIIDLLMQLQWWELPTETIRKINKDLSRHPSTELIQKLIEQYAPGAARAY